MILFVVAVLPIFLLGLYIYKKDINKEPTKLLVKLFIGGILSCFLVLIITSILELFFPIFEEELDNLNLIELFISVFIGIALVEEFCKWIITYKISYNNKEFDEIYDMIVYSVFVSLGFAFFENLFYVYENGIGTGIVRAFLSVPGHVSDAVFMGYYLGLAKLDFYNNKKQSKNLIYSILVPTITHGIYDYLIFSEYNLFILIFFIFIIVLDVLTIKKIKKVSKNNRKLKYKNNYCSNCGHIVNDNYCPNCGKKNE